MKWLIVIAMMCSGLFAKTNPDILIYSKSSSDWNVFLLDSFQVLMKNLRLGVDPYRYVEKNDIIYDKSSIDEFVSDDVSTLISDLEKASGLKLLKLQPEIRLKEFGYSIGAIDPKIEPKEDEKGDVTLSASIALNNITGFAKYLTLGFVLNDKKTDELIHVLDINVLNPRVILKENNQLNFDLDLKFEEKADGNKTKLNFLKADFSKITETLKKNPDALDIVYDGVQVPEIELRLMGRELLVNATKIREIIDSNKEKIKTVLLEQVQVLFERDGALEVLKHFDGKMFKNDRWIMPTSNKIFPVYLGIEDYFVPQDNIFGIELAGNFCTTRAFSQHGPECTEEENRETKVPVSLSEDIDQQNSKDKLLETFNSDDDVSMILSASEDYINKVIATTIDFGLWDQMINDVGLRFGDQGAQIRINKEGNTATLYLDVIYEAKGFKKFLLREGSIRFPVTLDVTARVESREEIFRDENGRMRKRLMPHVIFNIFDVDLNEKHFRYGIEEYGLPTTIGNIRKIFRKKVLKMIKKQLVGYDAPNEKHQLVDWKGTDTPAISLPEISNLSLDKAEVRSDGTGRLNIIMKKSKVLSDQ